MCGIAGIMALNGRALKEPQAVRIMTDRLAHRGPDDEGYYVNDERTVSLGHRRLRIIDLESGRQPLGNEDGSIWVVFNGEIYGYQRLRTELEARGHRFRTNTDTEVIVHAYEEDGLGCLARLKGMFAFALWDDRLKALLVARDRIGKKPLYYCRDGTSFLFASELEALTAMPGVSRDVDEFGVDACLTLGYIPAPRTIYRHIQKLEAGHYMVLTGRDERHARYWSPQQRLPAGPVEWAEAKREVVTRLRDATAIRMISDVPLGCFLSGGVDSSTVLSFMAELSPGPVKTFSIGFPEAEFSELKHARLLARHFGTDHHEYVLEPDGLTALDQVVAHFGEPFADSSALPTWYLSQLTKKTVTVALTGDGGDEVFGGYRWYRTGQFLDRVSRVPPAVLSAARRLGAGSGPRLLRRIGKVAALAMLEPGARHAALRSLLPEDVKGRLYTESFARRIDAAAMRWLAAEFDQTRGEDAVNRMMATDVTTYLAEDLMVKVDRMSMAHALECRSPLLDADLAEWAFTLPSRFKLDGGIRAGAAVPRHGQTGKRLLRAAVRDRFPRGFLERPKQGFSVPLDRWFQGRLAPVIKERLADGPLRRLGLFGEAQLSGILDEHTTGRRDHSATLWGVLVLATWSQRGLA